jgi:hypothetical protein
MSRDIAILDFSNPATVKMVIEFIKSRRGLHWWQCRKCRGQRSLKQNAYYFGVVLIRVAAGIRDQWGEEMFGVEAAHEFCKDRFLARYVVNKVTGEEHDKIVRSTTELDKMEFSEYIQKIKDFARDYLNTDIPEAM